MWIQHKRAILSDAMRVSGVLPALEWLARKPSLVVLVYHRVGEPRTDRFYAPLISATPEAFLAQMRWLRNRFRMLSLDDLSGLVSADAGHIDLREPCALVTFDDGYQDNLTIAAPIARECGISPVLFATTGFIGGKLVPWWDTVAWIVRQTPRPTIDIEQPDRVTINVESRSRDSAITSAIDVYIRAGWTAADGDLVHLAERAEVDLDECPSNAQGLFLDARDLKSLQTEGWSIGAHTATHRRLASLDDATQRDELALPKAELERLLDVPVRAVAYPFGGHDAFDASTQRLACETGYDFGFALRPSVIRPGPIDRYAIPRISVDHQDSLSLLRARLAIATATGRMLF